MLTITQFAKALGVSYFTAYRYVTSGAVQGVNVNPNKLSKQKTLRVPQSEVERVLTGGMIGAREESETAHDESISVPV